MVTVETQKLTWVAVQFFSSNWVHDRKPIKAARVKAFAWVRGSNLQYTNYGSKQSIMSKLIPIISDGEDRRAVTPLLFAFMVCAVHKITPFMTCLTRKGIKSFEPGRIRDKMIYLHAIQTNSEA